MLLKTTLKFPVDPAINKLRIDMYIKKQSFKHLFWDKKWVWCNQKIPCIPPLFHQNKYAADLKMKTKLFNCFLPNGIL